MMPMRTPDPCRACGDGTQSISARSDDGGSLLKGRVRPARCPDLAGGLAPVHVVDAQFLGLAVDAVLECLGILVLGGFADDQGRGRPRVSGRPTEAGAARSWRQRYRLQEVRAGVRRVY